MNLTLRAKIVLTLLVIIVGFLIIFAIIRLASLANRQQQSVNAPTTQAPAPVAPSAARGGLRLDSSGLSRVDHEAGDRPAARLPAPASADRHRACRLSSDLAAIPIKAVLRIFQIFYRL